MNVIDYFKEISKIPRESGNEKQIAKYLCDFAKKRNLEYYIDSNYNVIIKKNVCKGEPLILQAHTDMVCEKEKDKSFDFKRDSIEILEKDGYLTANGTTLGADNGIGVAQILYILDSEIECNIEAVFTASEETSMSGAFGLDTSKLKGKLLLNLDGFEEDTIIIESAAFSDIIMELKYSFVKPDIKYNNRYKIKLFGLKGGHSGFDINKNRGNSSIILANILKAIKEFEIESFEGGTKFNVIPSEAEAIIRANIDINLLNEIIEEAKVKIGREELKIEIDRLDEDKKNTVLTKENTIKFVKNLIDFPNGVINKNEAGETTSSINLGVVNLKENIFKIGMRSSRKTEEDKALNMLLDYSNKNDMKFDVIGHQPGFETNKEDKIVRLLKKAFYDIEENKEKNLKIQAVHITVEIGIIKEKMPNIQVAIISPDIQGAHTTQEKVGIESINRTTKWIEKFIKIFKKTI